MYRKIIKIVTCIMLCFGIVGYGVSVYAPGKTGTPEGLLVVQRFVGKITAYTPSFEETGKYDGLTASGEPARPGIVASDDLPIGTIVRIAGKLYRVADIFGGGYKERIDICMEDKQEAIKFGVQYLEVEVLDEQVPGMWPSQD